jgi:hypothetical protein
MMCGFRSLTAVMCLVLGGSAVNTIAEEQATTFAFTGFFDPVANAPVVNGVRAGVAVPVRFSLGGNRGLDIFAAEYPHVRWVECEANKPILAVWEETVTAADNSLTYDAVSTRYTYVWKTQKTWVGLCGELQLKLTDGEIYRARFMFGSS